MRGSTLLVLEKWNPDIRALAGAVAAEDGAWTALKAHEPEKCEACDFGATLDRCDTHLELYRAWNRAKMRRMLAEGRALLPPEAGEDLR